MSSAAPKGDEISGTKEKTLPDSIAANLEDKNQVGASEGRCSMSTYVTLIRPKQQRKGISSITLATHEFSLTRKELLVRVFEIRHEATSVPEHL
jgi:hypothetical protein